MAINNRNLKVNWGECRSSTGQENQSIPEEEHSIEFIRRELLLQKKKLPFASPSRLGQTVATARNRQINEWASPT